MLRSIVEFIVGRNHINVKFVHLLSELRVTLRSILEFITGRNHINVTFVISMFSFIYSSRSFENSYQNSHWGATI